MVPHNFAAYGSQAKACMKLHEALEVTGTVLNPSCTALDLGAAPGSWTQYVESAHRSTYLNALRGSCCVSACACVVVCLCLPVYLSVGFTSPDNRARA